MQQLRKSDRNVALAMIAPAVIFLLLLTTLPMMYILYLSLSDWNILRSPVPKIQGFQNYAKMFKDSCFWQSLWVTLKFTIISLIVEMVLGIIVALNLNREFLLKKLVRGIVLIPMMLTPAVIALIWRILLNPQFGIINYMLESVGIEGPLWLADPKLAMASIIIVEIWEWTPFIALSALAALQSIPKEIFESASIDGAPRLKLLWYITLPLIKPVLFIAGSFRLGALLRWFDTFYVMTAGGPGRATQNLPMYIYESGFFYYDMGYSATLAMFLLILTIVISYTFIKASNIDKG